MIKFVITAVLGTLLFFVGVKIFAIVFWTTGANILADILTIEEVDHAIQESNTSAKEENDG